MTKRNSIYENLPAQLNELAKLLGAEAKGMHLLFIENWNPKLSNNYSANIRLHLNFESELSLKGKELKYAHFPLWSKLSDDKGVSRLTIDQNKLPFDGSKSGIASSVHGSEFRYGLLLVVAELNYDWSPNEIELITSFSRLIATGVEQNKNFVKHIFDLEVQLSRKNRKHDLSHLPKDQNLLAGILKEDQFEASEGGEINWKEADSAIDEVWVNIQAYTEGEFDPVKSIWYKLKDASRIEELREKPMDEIHPLLKVV